MRRFSVSIEDTILRMPQDGEDTGSTNQKQDKVKTTNQQADATQRQAKEQQAQADQLERSVELNDQLYERLVNSIAKSKELYDIRQESYKLTGEEVELLKAQLALQDSYLNLIGQEADQQIKTLELLKKARQQENQDAKLIEKLENQITEQNQKRTQYQEEINKLASDYGLKLKTQSKEFRDAEKTLRDMGASEDERIAAAKIINDLSESDKATTQKTLEIQQKIDGVSGKISETLGISAKFSNTKLGNFSKIVGEANKLSGGKGLGLVTTMMKKSVGQMFQAKNLFASIVEFAAESAIEISNLSRNLGAATGFGDKFNTEIA